MSQLIVYIFHNYEHDIFQEMLFTYLYITSTNDLLFIITWKSSKRFIVATSVLIFSFDVSV